MQKSSILQLSPLLLNLSSLRLDSILTKTGVKKRYYPITTTTGPGAFTSIRITLSSVLAISLGLKIPVYTLDSLKTSALAAFYSKKIQEKQNIRKAYKGELYTANFSKTSLLQETPTKPKMQTPTEFMKEVKIKKIF